jgi:hypothetical protein
VKSHAAPSAARPVHVPTVPVGIEHSPTAQPTSFPFTAPQGWPALAAESYAAHVPLTHRNPSAQVCDLPQAAPPPAGGAHVACDVQNKPGAQPRVGVHGWPSMGGLAQTPHALGPMAQ